MRQRASHLREQAIVVLVESSSDEARLLELDGSADRGCHGWVTQSQCARVLRWALERERGCCAVRAVTTLSARAHRTVPQRHKVRATQCTECPVEPVGRIHDYAHAGDDESGLRLSANELGGHRCSGTHQNSRPACAADESGRQRRDIVRAHAAPLSAHDPCCSSPHTALAWRSNACRLGCLRNKRTCGSITSRRPAPKRPAVSRQPAGGTRARPCMQGAACGPGPLWTCDPKPGAPLDIAVQAPSQSLAHRAVCYFTNGSPLVPAHLVPARVRPSKPCAAACSTRTRLHISTRRRTR